MFVSSKSAMSLMFKANSLANQPHRLFFSRFFSSSLNDPKNPYVYFDINRDNKPIGRITFELYKNKVPKTAENFRSICAGDNKMGYTYANSHFHRIIDGFMA